ncbi:hypothetical protein [Caballeronia sp. LZ001]|uniref:hypothetical protein n=1 Tax=Caballeronia sp. LZ001 TaxID=3038553 RepID=UPI002863F3A0|nr:hypothetical protein [Caballeronia sp. LZ001]MDR5802817.1 hypothetical protein [Caballeronia sp. LZ001]
MLKPVAPAEEPGVRQFRCGKRRQRHGEVVALGIAAYRARVGRQLSVDSQRATVTCRCGVRGSACQRHGHRDQRKNDLLHNKYSLVVT